MPPVMDWTNYKNASDMTAWKKTRKKKYFCWVCMPPLGTKVYNNLEDAYYETSEKRPFVISGTLGEQWVIGFEKLIGDQADYVLADGTVLGTPITMNWLKSQGHPYKIGWFKVMINPRVVIQYWAYHIPKDTKFKVQTGWGDVLIGNRAGIQHAFGDYLCCKDICGMPNMNDVWIINGCVFPTTYDMHGFPGLSYKDCEEFAKNPEKPTGFAKKEK